MPPAESVLGLARILRCAHYRDVSLRSIWNRMTLEKMVTGFSLPYHTCVPNLLHGGIRLRTEETPSQIVQSGIANLCPEQHTVFLLW
jgi:hypothetical protein